MHVRKLRQHTTPLNPLNERNLLDTESWSRWTGLDMGWVEADAHTASRTESDAPLCLALLDTGRARAEFRYGLRTHIHELRQGSLGLFTPGSHPDGYQWSCEGVRRIMLTYDDRHLDDPVLADVIRQYPLRLDLEFYDDALAATLRAMVSEVKAGCPHGWLFAESLSLGVVTHLHQRVAGQNTLMRERGKLTPGQARRVVDYINGHLRQELSVGELADVVGFSRTQFSRLFKNTFACTPYQFVLSARLQRARDLLLNTRHPLSEVATEAGFSSQSHMSSTLLRVDGVTPGSLRRQSS